ncbi:MAG: hypothetical protein ACKVX7_05470 [Planctomycetota bacterium]
MFNRALVSLVLSLLLSSISHAGDFPAGLLLIASSRTDEVRIYDAETLVFQSAFTHPAFSTVASPVFTYGPNGMAFNGQGNLVVAAYASFVEFSAPGVPIATYPKVTAEATENIIFDSLGNLYTTTATGGSGLLNQYSAAGYVFAQTITLPAGAGQLTGITFDSQQRLYVASQSDARIHVLDADATFTTFTWSHSIQSANPGSLEGLQFNFNGELVAAGGNLVRYDPDTGAVLGSFDAPTDAWPVSVTVDSQGRIYVSDYENGLGTLPADIFRFTPDGSAFISQNDAGLFGPFGNVISSTSLPGGPEYFIRGDANNDAVLNIADPVSILLALFPSGGAGTGPIPTCIDACDANDDGDLDIADPVAVLNYLFASGPLLPEPFVLGLLAGGAFDPTHCGPDPTLDSASYWGQSLTLTGQGVDDDQMNCVSAAACTP